MVYKNFGSNILTSAEVNDYLMRQTIIVVANSTARDAITSPIAGMTVYRQDLNLTETYNGTSWEGAWTAVTPAFTNLTVGSGTSSGRYKKVGRLVTYQGYWAFGAGSAVGTNPALTLPVTSISYVGAQTLGSLSMLDNGTTYAAGWVRWLSTTSAQLMPASGTGLTATAPWTWATGDQIAWSITWESAA